VNLAPKSGTLKPLEIVGETNAMVYFDLITHKFVGKNYVRCLRTFIYPSKYCDLTLQNVYYVLIEKLTFQDKNISSGSEG